MILRFLWNLAMHVKNPDAGQERCHPGRPEPARNWFLVVRTHEHRELVAQRHRGTAKPDMPRMGRHEFTKEETTAH